MGWWSGAWAKQVELQQRYLERTAVSGLEARVAARWLRWSGYRLLGDVLPPERR